MSLHRQQWLNSSKIQVESMYIQNSSKNRSVENPCEANDKHCDVISVHFQVILQDLYDSNHQLHKATTFSMVLSFKGWKKKEMNSKPRKIYLCKRFLVVKLHIEEENYLVSNSIELIEVEMSNSVMSN